jgi:hypothetical protein
MCLHGVQRDSFTLLFTYTHFTNKKDDFLIAVSKSFSQTSVIYFLTTKRDGEWLQVPTLLGQPIRHISAFTLPSFIPSPLHNTLS